MIKAKGLKITIIKEPVTLVGSETDSLIKNLIGNSMEFVLSLFDYYVRDNLGIFIPILESIGARAINHKHPAYEIMINFDAHSSMSKHYHAEITSPNILHNNTQNMYCYYIFIDKDYFEKRFLMYSKEIPIFECVFEYVFNVIDNATCAKIQFLGKDEAIEMLQVFWLMKQ